MELASLTIHVLHDKLVSGEVSAMALTEAVLTRQASRPTASSCSGQRKV